MCDVPLLSHVYRYYIFMCVILYITTVCKYMYPVPRLTLTLPGPSAGVSGSLDSYCSLKPLCSGMGEVVPARTSPTLLPPSPRTVLSLACFKVLQCINCRDWHCKSQMEYYDFLMSYHTAVCYLGQVRSS